MMLPLFFCDSVLLFAIFFFWNAAAKSTFHLKSVPLYNILENTGFKTQRHSISPYIEGVQGKKKAEWARQVVVVSYH